MRMRARAAVAAVVLVGAGVGVYAVGRANAPQAASAASGTTTTTSSGSSSGSGSNTTVPSTMTAFYLDLGASASLGFQPTGVAHHNGARTDTGYANDLVYREALRGVTLTLTQMGCPGDIVQTLLNTTQADHCYQPPNTQLTKAVAFLQANQGEPGLVTVDLGFNNIRVCLNKAPINEGCVAAAIAAVRVDLPKILAQLKAAAGPDVRIVGLEYNDPYLGYYLDGASGPAEATSTLVAMDAMNAALAKIYPAAGIAVADVPALFQTDDTTQVTVANFGSVPANVEAACQLTWFCYGAPFGPDDHPNNAGYSLIAQAIEDVLPAKW